MAKRTVRPTFELVDITSLVPDPINAREHNPRNIGMIGDSLQEVGAWRSIGIDEENTVYMGNGVVEAAQERGIRRVLVVDADGETLVAVRRTGLSPEQKQRGALYDNRTAETAAWNTGALTQLHEAGVSFENLWTDAERIKLLARIGSGRETPAADDGAATVEDEAPAAAEMPHRHLCPACGHEWIDGQEGET